MNSIMQTQLNHSSVRSYQDKAIASDLLLDILRCGQAAASSSFIQAYSVIQVNDPDKRKTIAQAAGNQRWVVAAPEFLVICADLSRVEYCCQKHQQGDLEGYTEHFMAATVDAALMAQNMMLAVESVGLGGVFIGGIRNDPQTVANTLELPGQVYPVCGLCLGWPKQTMSVKPRLPVQAVLHQDRFDTAKTQVMVDDYDEVMTAYYAERSFNNKSTNWSEQTARAIQGKKREHMLEFLQQRGFVKC